MAFGVGDRVKCLCPGSWPDGQVGTVTALGVTASDGEQGYAVQIEGVGVTVLGENEVGTVCPRCEGSGQYRNFPGQKPRPCAVCDGIGTIDHLGDDDPPQHWFGNPDCSGPDPADEMYPD